MNPLSLAKQGSLLHPTTPLVQEAHNLLVDSGYELVGYHGTNQRAVRGILINGFDPTFAGSSAGLARGPGLYVARHFTMAADFADTATQAGEPDLRGNIPRRQGLGGQQAVMRVYALHFSAMQEGTHYVWGRMGGTAIAGAGVVNNLAEQEIVIRPRSFGSLVGIPTTLAIEQALRGMASPSTRPSLRLHEAPF